MSYTRKARRNHHVRQRGGNNFTRNGGKLEKRRLNLQACHPAMKKNALYDNTCFSSGLLEKIVREHNRRNPHRPIDDHVKQKQIHQLRKSYKETCRGENESSQDNCIAKHLGVKGLPVPPKRKWKKKNEWLTNIDIEMVMKMHEESYKEFEFIGPVPIDFKDVCSENLCKVSVEEWLKQGKTKIGIIFNFDRHDERGSHWVSMYVDIKAGIVFYFDSAGISNTPKDTFEKIQDLANEIIQQARKLRYKLTFYVGRIEHQEGNTECGMYSLFFIITWLTRRVEFHNKTLTKNEVMGIFNSNHVHIPDAYIQQYRSIYFS